MSGGYLFGWDSVNVVWTKLLCNADGELLIDPTLILEDTPTDGELEKAPTSNWAYDHENDTEAHHVKYTDVESRAAIHDIFDADGKLIHTLECNNQIFNNVRYFMFQELVTSNYTGLMFHHSTVPVYRIWSKHKDNGYQNSSIQLYKTDHYVYVVDAESFQANLALFLEEAPTNGVVNKAPTSNWAFDHDADAAAHHVKYTDLEAQTACNLNGDLYWSLSGIGFLTELPDTDDVRRHSNGYILISADAINLRAPVILPDGATVTEVVVYGNAGAESETWTLTRFTTSNQVTAAMASAVVNTADASISNPTIDNSLYNYFLWINGLLTDDRIYGARIKYTL